MVNGRPFSDLVKEGRKYKIIDGIPRFVEDEGYSDTFSLQWRTFGNPRKNKSFHKAELMDRTGWSEEFLKNKLVLECGCGSGSDTEILLSMGAKVVAFDLSQGVETAYENLKGEKNLVGLFQADILDIPLKQQSFDIVFCHRVLQHTPDPKKAFMEMAEFVKPKGLMFMHSYDKSAQNLSNWKYKYRWISTRLNKKTVYNIVRLYAPYAKKICYLLDRHSIGRILHHNLLPYYTMPPQYKTEELSDKEEEEFEILVTLDALTPKYDNPIHPKTMKKWFEYSGFEYIELRGRNPVIMIGKKR